MISAVTAMSGPESDGSRSPIVSPARPTGRRTMNRAPPLDRSLRTAACAAPPSAGQARPVGHAEEVLQAAGDERRLVARIFDADLPPGECDPVGRELVEGSPRRAELIL